MNVTNAAPVLRLNDITLSDTSGGLLSEADEVTLRGLMNDPGLLDPHTVTIRWGDADANGENETVETLELEPGVFGFEFNHTYPDDGPTGVPFAEYTISIEIDDGDGGVIERLIPITINNTAPDVRILDDGTDDDFIRVRAQVKDNPLDTLTYQWSVFDPSGESA